MGSGTMSVVGYRLLFLALSVAIIFVRLLPLDFGPGQLPGPDLLTILAIAWVVLRPSLVPVWLIVLVIFAGDILFMRPLGLWTLLVVLATEFLRSRNLLLRDTPFLLEWLMVGAVIAAIFVLNSAILAVFAVTQPTLGLTLIGMVATILCYPLVVILAGRAFGLRKATPGETDMLGRRI